MTIWSLCLCICSNLDDVVQLLSSVVEVLADVGGDLFAGVLHRKREDVLNHGLAPTAPRTSLQRRPSKEGTKRKNEKEILWKMRKGYHNEKSKMGNNYEKERRQLAMQCKKIKHGERENVINLGLVPTASRASLYRDIQ